MSLDLVEDRPHYVAEVANDVDDGGDFTAAASPSASEWFLIVVVLGVFVASAALLFFVVFIALWLASPDTAGAEELQHGQD